MMIMRMMRMTRMKTKMPIATEFFPALKHSERVFPFVFWGKKIVILKSNNNDDKNVLLHQVTIFSPLMR